MSALFCNVRVYLTFLQANLPPCSKAFPTDEIQGINEGGTDLQTNLEDNTNRSEKEKEKAEGMIEIVGDTEAGPEDETEDEPESLPENTPAWATVLFAQTRSMKEKMSKVDFKAFKGIEYKTEISPTQKDVPPVRTV